MNAFPQTFPSGRSFRRLIAFSSFRRFAMQRLIAFSSFRRSRFAVPGHSCFGFVVGNARFFPRFRGSLVQEGVLCPAWAHSRCFATAAEDVYSDDDYGYEDRKGCRSYANIDAWKWKLNVLIRNPLEREIITRDKKDKRDYEYLGSLAKRLGLYSQFYGKAVVFSKDPLPNYRPDMDDRRPMRKVSIPLPVHQVVDKIFEEHLECKELFQTKALRDDLASQEIDGTARKTLYNRGRLFTALEPAILQEDLSMQSPFADNLLKRSSHISDKQKAWQESPEGQKMMAFRKILPAYRERDSFLSMILKHQTVADI